MVRHVVAHPLRERDVVGDEALIVAAFDEPGR
jgi:hypothetical protein